MGAASVPAAQRGTAVALHKRLAAPDSKGSDDGEAHTKAAVAPVFPVSVPTGLGNREVIAAALTRHRRCNCRVRHGEPGP